MNNEEFQKEIKRLRRRLELLRLARSGDVNVKKIHVKGHKVRAHTVKVHTRIIYTRRDK